MSEADEFAPGGAHDETSNPMMASTDSSELLERVRKVIANAHPRIPEWRYDLDAADAALTELAERLAAAEANINERIIRLNQDHAGVIRRAQERQHAAEAQRDELLEWLRKSGIELPVDLRAAIAKVEQPTREPSPGPFVDEIEESWARKVEGGGE